MCGVVGLKPTVGHISDKGIIPLAPTQDTAGPIGKCVEDVKLLYEVMAGMMGELTTTLAANATNYPDTSDSNLTDKDNGDISLTGMRIGVLDKQFEAMLDVENRGCFSRVVEMMEKSSAHIIPIDNKYFSEDSNLIDDITILLYEFKAGINEYLKNTEASSPVHSLKELIEFNEAHKETTLPYGQDILIEADKTSGTFNGARIYKRRTK